MQSQEGLSTRDASVLDFVFDASPVAQSETIERTETETQSLALENEAIKLAEGGKLEAAETMLTEAIETYRGCSAYNNRAQVRQFRKNLDGALQDLDRAILLGEARVPRDELTLRQAHTQRGLVYKLRNREDEARAEFEAASALGSVLAKKEAAKLNPISQLCGNVVAEMMGYGDLHKSNV